MTPPFYKLYKKKEKWSGVASLSFASLYSNVYFPIVVPSFNIVRHPADVMVVTNMRFALRLVSSVHSFQLQGSAIHACHHVAQVRHCVALEQPLFQPM